MMIRFKSAIKVFLIVLTVLSLSGCGGLDEIPADKQNYIGTWYGQYMVLRISADARVDYKYEKDSSIKSISAPILEFSGDNFKVGALGIDTEFVVNRPPYLEDGIWKMVVDNQLVLRKANKPLLETEIKGKIT